MLHIGPELSLTCKPSSCTGCTVSGTTGVSLPTPDSDVVAAMITTEQDGIRFRWDGEVPDAEGIDGSLSLPITNSMVVSGRDIITAIKMVPASSSAWVSVGYIRA